MAELALHKIAVDRFRADHKAAGVQLDKDPVIFDEAAKQRRSLGRYTLEEAAVFIAIKGSANYRSILRGIEKSIALGHLHSYLPGENGIYEGDGLCCPWRDEVYAFDMNAWIDQNQTRIGHIFPVVSDVSAQKDSSAGIAIPKGHKKRKGVLDHHIEKAIKQTGGMDATEVYFALKKKILDDEDNVLPFTGLVEGGLWYIGQDEQLQMLTIDVLRQRLKRRRL